MYFFKFFRNQLWQHLTIYNSFRNVNMHLLEAALVKNAEATISSGRVE